MYYKFLFVELLELRA